MFSDETLHQINTQLDNELLIYPPNLEATLANTEQENISVAWGSLKWYFCSLVRI